MTWRTAALSCRGQVTVALMLGVYLTVGSRTHFNQMLNDARADAGSAYSTANAVYQTAYAAVQVPAFVYADRVNPVPVLGVAVAGVAVTSAVAPFAFEAIGSGPAAFALVACLYAVNGALGGVWWPFMSSMLANWAPAAELAYMYAVVNTGLPGGIALGNAYTGLYYGVHGTAFRYSFFVVAAACALWAVTWLCAFHRYPADDPGVGPDELNYLSENVTRPKTDGGQATRAVPWRRMAVSGPVWCVLLANYGSTVFYIVLVVYMPAYLKNVLHVNVSLNGFMSAAPPLGQMIVMYVTGAAASFVHRRAWAGVTAIRKTFTFVGMVGPACALAAATTAFAGQYAFYYTLMAAYAVSGAVFSGFRVSQLELAPNYAAAVTAVCDLVGSLAMNTAHVAFAAGVVGPESEQRTWDRLCWGLSAVLVAFAGPFLLFGTSEPQPWNDAPAGT